MWVTLVYLQPCTEHGGGVTKSMVDPLFFKHCARALGMGATRPEEVAQEGRK